MAGTTPTAVLAEDIHELKSSNERIADEVKRIADRLAIEIKESRREFAEAIEKSNLRFAAEMKEMYRELNGKIEADHREFMTSQTEAAKNLNGIEKSLTRIEERVNNWVGWTKAGVTILTMVVLGMWTVIYQSASQSSRLEERVSQLITKIDEAARWEIRVPSADLHEKHPTKIQ
jgi:hypothetical protein